MKISLKSIALIIFVLVTWELIISLIDHSRIAANETKISLFIPGPVAIFSTFIQDIELIVSNLAITISRAIIGLLIAVPVAFLINIIILYKPSLRHPIMPLTMSINSFPIIGLTPLIVLLFGQGTNSSIIVISALISYFPIMISLDHSFRSVENEIIDLLKVYNASIKDDLLKVRIPLSIPSFFNILKLAIPASIIGATIGEWLGAKKGIGQLITVSLYRLDTDLVYAALISLMIVSFLLISLVNLFEKRIAPWTKYN